MQTDAKIRPISTGWFDRFSGEWSDNRRLRSQQMCRMAQLRLIFAVFVLISNNPGPELDQDQ